MNPFLTCSSLPHPLHRNAIRSPHRQSHRRWIWAIYAALKPSFTERPAQRQRCAPEPVAVLRPQSLAWDRHREIEGKFCKVVGGVAATRLAYLSCSSCSTGSPLSITGPPKETQSRKSL